MPHIGMYQVTMKQTGKEPVSTGDVDRWLPELKSLLAHFDVVKAVITIKTNDGNVADFVVERKSAPTSTASLYNSRVPDRDVR